MREETKKINVGLGFVTGRKNFRNVARAYLNNWNESERPDLKNYAFHLFVAYDLKFTNTKKSDYVITDEEILGMVDSVYYLGKEAIANEAAALAKQRVVSEKEAKLIFGEGYAMKRNAVLYFALKNQMDYLIFLDDDEYPVANIRVGDILVWKGQEVLETHIRNLPDADMTHGRHCGYISPIPNIAFNDVLKEEDFRMFIEAVSNDIVNWDSVKAKIKDGGITYAALTLNNHGKAEAVKEVNGMKFISGANLGFNLKSIDKIFPFYNPPGARGEDTFLSTCIGECHVSKVPCYTFHDGFAAYKSMLMGVLPNHLKEVDAGTGVISKRFLKAAVGWTRYKPLLLYITRRDDYEELIRNMKADLETVIPKFEAYFPNDDFGVILKELQYYSGHVEKHFLDFENTKKAWVKIISALKKKNGEADLGKRVGM